jgi:hypothetical protein
MDCIFGPLVLAFCTLFTAYICGINMKGGNHNEQIPNSLEFGISRFEFGILIFGICQL